MKLKVFDLWDVDDPSDKLNELKEKIKPYVIYFINDDTTCICLNKNIGKVKNIIIDVGYDLEDFYIENLDKFCNGGGWDYTYLGDTEIDGDDVWKEFGKLIKQNENELIEAKDFEQVWFKYQKIALENIFHKIIRDIKIQLEKDIEEGLKDLSKRQGIYK